MKIFNQYSLLWGVAFFCAILAILLFRGGIKKTSFVILGGTVILIALVWMIVRPRATPANQTDDIRSRIGAGTPVLLEFQSPY